MATEAPFRTPRQPKLRSSCDRCGAAKLKCDRGQPECGRCLSLGQICVYGVSRKMGKPPRERLRIPDMPSASRLLHEHGGGMNRERPHDNGSGGSAASGSVRNNIVAFSPFSSVNNLPSALGTVETNPDTFMTSVVPDSLQTDLFGPSAFPDFSSLEFSDEFLSTNLETEAIFTWGSPEGSSNGVAQTKASQTQADEPMCFESALVLPTGGNSHDCSREAYDILGRLSFFGGDKTHPIARLAPGSASTTASTIRHVPLDHILRLNRESIERLSRLLTCSCATRPHLAFLFASIISRILIWYQQAAGCTQGNFPEPIAADPVLGYMSGSTTGSASPWSSATVSTVNTNGPSTPPMTGAITATVAPTQMAMGSFDIDDQQVQTALRIQLLLGEIKRTGYLIDLFTSRNSSSIDEFTFSSVDSLYKSLSSWLRKEHSRITDIIKDKLRETTN